MAQQIDADDELSRALQARLRKALTQALQIFQTAYAAAPGASRSAVPGKPKRSGKAA
jgi:hypothetical protein